MHSSFVITNVFGNTNTSDIHDPLPPFKQLTKEDIRKLGFSGEIPVCIKYVILSNGELILSRQWSETVALTAAEQKQYQHVSASNHLKIDGKTYPVHILRNSDMIIFDPQSKLPSAKKILLKHPEIAGGRDVLAAGDGYVKDGKFIMKHPSGLYGINNWTGHYCVTGRALKDVVESTFKSCGAITFDPDI